MNSINILLFLILITYLFPICITCFKYDNNTSISSIIYNFKFTYIFFFTIMSLLIIIYEYKRKENIPFYSIFFLIINIYIIILTDENKIIHKISCYLTFILIIIFELYYSIKLNNIILYILLSIQILLSIIIYLNKKYFFKLECLIILIFGIFYLYLHFFKENFRN